MNEDERFTEAVISIFTDSGHCMVEIVTISVLVSCKEVPHRHTVTIALEVKSRNAKCASYSKTNWALNAKEALFFCLTPASPFTALGGGGSGGFWDDGHLPLLEQTANLLVLLLLQTKRRRRTLSGEARTQTMEKSSIPDALKEEDISSNVPSLLSFNPGLP